MLTSCVGGLCGDVAGTQRLCLSCASTWNVEKQVVLHIPRRNKPQDITLSTLGRVVGSNYVVRYISKQPPEIAVLAN